MPEVNIPLLRKAVEWAEAEAAKPAFECEWEQGEWISTRDDRAWFLATRELGDDADLDAIGDRADQIEDQLSCGTCYCIAGYVAQSVDERFAQKKYVAGVHVEDFARDALGLGNREARDLFRSRNTIEDVRRIAEDIAGERL